MAHLVPSCPPRPNPLLCFSSWDTVLSLSLHPSMDRGKSLWRLCFESSGSIASKEERVGGPVLSRDVDLLRHSELRRPELGGREVMHEPLQSLFNSEVIFSALSSFTLQRLNSSQVSGKDIKSKLLQILCVLFPVHPPVICLSPILSWS